MHVIVKNNFHSDYLTYYLGPGVLEPSYYLNYSGAEHTCNILLTTLLAFELSYELTILLIQ